MKYKDRADILGQLKDAFEIENVTDTRITTEVVSFDGHNIARVTNIAPPPQCEEVYNKYPKAYIVKRLIGILRASENPKAPKVCERLETLLVSIDPATDRFEQYLSMCLDCEHRIYGSSTNSAQREMAIYYTINKITGFN